MFTQHFHLQSIGQKVQNNIKFHFHAKKFANKKILNFGEVKEYWPWMLKPSLHSSSNIRNKWWWSFQLLYECVHMCENGKNVLSYAEFLYYWLKGREIKITLLEVCLTTKMFLIKDPNVKNQNKERYEMKMERWQTTSGRCSL